MEFTLYFLRIFFSDLLYASPLLSFLVLSIGLVGYRIGRLEGWTASDALYHAFINATTVGYGDLYPTRKRSKLLSLVLAFVGLIFTGIIVAIALHAAEYAYSAIYDTVGFTGRVAE